MAVKVIRKFRNLFDVTFGTPSDGDVVTYDSGTDKLTLAPPTGGGGGPPSGSAGGVLGGTYPNPSFAADMATQAELDAHVNDAGDAHDASAISFSPVGTIAATDVQAAIAEVASEAGTGSGSGESLVLEIAQTAHGLDVGDWVRLDSSGDYVAAQANSETNAEVVGLVVAEADANNFTLQRSGYVGAGLSGLTAGTVYFLSPSTPGVITATEPTADGQVSKPLIVAESATTGWMSAEMRGVLVPGEGGTSLSLDVTQNAHGLDVGDWVRLDGTDYVLAQADSVANAEVVGVVTAEADANNFTITTGGHVGGLSGLTAGTVYFLDETTAGAITATEPSVSGEVSKPVLIADSTTGGWLFNMRGAVVSALQLRTVLSPGAATLPDGTTDNAAPAISLRKGTQTGTDIHLLTLDFDASADEHCFWSFVIPTDYGSGGALRLLWMANATSGTCRWGAQIGCVTPVDADTPLEHAFSTAATVGTATNATEARRVNESEITLNMDSAAPGDFITIHLYRDADGTSGTDDLAVDAELLMASLEYEGA